ncbi:MAG: glycoside hydrolase family 3 N-terminal domain-containing protein, partial [Mobilitalea sp.]
ILIFTGCSFTVPDKANSESIDNSLEIVVVTPISDPGEAAPTSTVAPVLSVSPTPILTPTTIITPEPSVTPTLTIKPVLTTSPSTSKPNPSNDQKTAEETLKNMTLEEKVGQLFFVRCRNDKAAADIKAYQLGGYILFAEDFKDKTKDEVVAAIQKYQYIAKIPMLIGVDEEGGSVNRISKFDEFRAVPFKSPQRLYKLGGYKLIISDTV